MKTQVKAHMKAHMKALILDAYGGVENFQLRDMPVPAPKSGEVRIRVQAISINPVDYKMRRGLIPSELPAILGRDVAGTIDAVGDGVTEFNVGDAVCAVLFGPRSNGAYAEYVSTATEFVCIKPKSLSFSQGAAMGVAGLTAHEAVMRKAKVQPGETVLVAGGAGGVGSFALPLLGCCGAASIIATTGGDESANYLTRNLGIPSEHLVFYPDQTLEDMTRRIQDLTDGRGVSTAFDFVGGQMKRLCFLATGFDGRVVSTVEEPAEFDFNIWRADVSPMFARSTSFHFVSLSARARNGGPRDWAVYRESMTELTTLIEDGRLTVPAVNELDGLSVASIGKAHTLLEAGHVKGKIALRVS